MSDLVYYSDNRKRSDSPHEDSTTGESPDSLYTLTTAVSSVRENCWFWGLVETNYRSLPNVYKAKW